MVYIDEPRPKGRGVIRYRVVDITTGKVRGLFLSKKSAYKGADKLEYGRGKYRMVVDKVTYKKPKRKPKKRKTKRKKKK